MIFVGTLTGITLWLIGIPSPLVFAVAAAVLELLPYIGPALSFAAPFLLALTISVPHAVAVLIAWAVVQSVESNVITPSIMSKKVHLPPALTIIAILAMAQLFGFLGALLATPVLAMILRLADQFAPE
jgi:predicted PurR-regulated permease PerM